MPESAGASATSCQAISSISTSTLLASSPSVARRATPRSRVENGHRHVCGWGALGGGASLGMGPNKVDRSAACICRQMAMSLLKSGLCNEHWCSYLVPSASQCPCLSLWRRTAQSRACSGQMTSPTASRSHSIAAQVRSHSAWRFASQSTR